MKNLKKIENKHLFSKFTKKKKKKKYAMQNQITNINKNFILKKSGSAKFSFAFIYNNQYFGVWNDWHER